MSRKTTVSITCLAIMLFCIGVLQFGFCEGVRIAFISKDKITPLDPVNCFTGSTNLWKNGDIVHMVNFPIMYTSKSKRIAPLQVVIKYGEGSAIAYDTSFFLVVPDGA